MADFGSYLASEAAFMQPIDASFTVAVACVGPEARRGVRR